MGIDYMIDFGCVPKEMLTSEGLLERIKAGDRAQSIIDFYRSNGDNRPIEDMGGEFMRRAAIGDEETSTIYVKDLLALHQDLEPYATYCEGCPANRTGQRFGCVGRIGYPISQAAEVWLLSKLPTPEEPLPFLLLTKAEEFGYKGDTAGALREANPGIIFQSVDQLARRYPEMDITGNQLFELFFLLGNIIPLKRMVMIMMFVGAFDRNLEAHQLMNLTPTPDDAATQFPFQMKITDADDASIRDFKAFFHAMYLAWTLNREIRIDV